jgi:hypothetical protein
MFVMPIREALDLQSSGKSPLVKLYCHNKEGDGEG